MKGPIGCGVLLLAPLAFGQNAAAQDEPQEDETEAAAVTQCDALSPASILQSAFETSDAFEESTDAIEAAQAMTADVLEDLPTSPIVSGAATASTIANFLPLFSFAGVSGDLEGTSGGSSSTDDVLGFDFNLPLAREGTSERQLKLQAGFNRNPTVLDSLVQALPADERDEFRTDAQQDLTITDDSTFSITYNVENEALGRNRRLLGEVFRAAIGSVSAADFRAKFTAIERMVNEFSTEQQATAFAEIDDVPLKKERCDNLIAARDALRDAATALDMAEDSVVDAARIETFAKLINNQPQLHASVSYKDRNPVVGANETALSITYEWGYRANVNLAEKKIARECETRTPECILRSFTDYVVTNASAIEAGDRLKFSLEYADVDDLSVVIEDPAFTYAKPGGNKLTSTLAYGRSLTADDGLFDSSRIDIEIKREAIDDDPDRNNRTIGTVTLTRSIGDVSFPFSLVYANKPEFVAMEATDKLSAHIGVKYEFPD